MNNINKKVRELFVNKVDSMGFDGKEKVSYNCVRYNNKVKGGSKVVWKSYGSERYKEVWEYIIGEINKIDGGWSLFEGASYRGDGSVYGMVRMGR